MNKLVIPMAVAALLAAGCVVTVPPGQSKKQFAPGQVQKQTGYNPASGKVKIR